MKIANQETPGQPTPGAATLGNGRNSTGQANQTFGGTKQPESRNEPERRETWKIKKQNTENEKKRDRSGTFEDRRNTEQVDSKSVLPPVMDSSMIARDRNGSVM